MQAGNCGEYPWFSASHREQLNMQSLLRCIDAVNRRQTMKRKEIHPSVTMQRVMDATQLEMTSLDNPGICLACGTDADGCEPDARKYECECCGAHEVYGAAELLIGGMYHS